MGSGWPRFDNLKKSCQICTHIHGINAGTMKLFYFLSFTLLLPLFAAHDNAVQPAPVRTGPAHNPSAITSNPRVNAECLAFSAKTLGMLNAEF